MFLGQRHVSTYNIGISKIVSCFWVSFAHQGCIYLIKNTVKMWQIITIKNGCFLCEYLFNCNWLLWSKAEFSASLLQSSVWHDPSEIIIICWFAAQETLLIIINVEKQHILMNRKVKNNVLVTYVTLVPWWREQRRYVVTTGDLLGCPNHLWL